MNNKMQKVFEGLGGVRRMMRAGEFGLDNARHLCGEILHGVKGNDIARWLADAVAFDGTQASSDEYAEKLRLVAEAGIVLDGEMPISWKKESSDTAVSESLGG